MKFLESLPHGAKSLASRLAVAGVLALTHCGHRQQVATSVSNAPQLARQHFVDLRLEPNEAEVLRFWFLQIWGGVPFNGGSHFWGEWRCPGDVLHGNENNMGSRTRGPVDTICEQIVAYTDDQRMRVETPDAGTQPRRILGIGGTAFNATESTFADAEGHFIANRLTLEMARYLEGVLGYTITSDRRILPDPSLDPRLLRNSAASLTCPADDAAEHDNHTLEYGCGTGLPENVSTFGQGQWIGLSLDRRRGLIGAYTNLASGLAHVRERHSDTHASLTLVQVQALRDLLQQVQFSDPTAEANRALIIDRLDQTLLAATRQPLPTAVPRVNNLHNRVVPIRVDATGTIPLGDILSGQRAVNAVEGQLDHTGQMTVANLLPLVQDYIVGEARAGASYIVASFNFTARRGSLGHPMQGYYSYGTSTRTNMLALIDSLAFAIDLEANRPAATGLSR